MMHDLFGFCLPLVSYIVAEFLQGIPYKKIVAVCLRLIPTDIGIQSIYLREGLYADT